ncbi:Phosphate-regulating neutral endopeptidase [Nymphon striatum]|nr:Phosphate-regulating neutral endopeptidase [Nymphon striatum]
MNYNEDNLHHENEDGSSSISEICFTDECIQAAAQIISKMNPHVNPCDDFYEYACGGYIATHEVHPDYPQRSLVSEMEENLAVLLKRSMERKILTENTTGAILKAKQLYKSCLNQGKIS